MRCKSIPNNVSFIGLHEILIEIQIKTNTEKHNEKKTDYKVYLGKTKTKLIRPIINQSKTVKKTSSFVLTIITLKKGKSTSK